MAAGTPESGTGDHESACDRVLAGELAAELLADLVDGATEDAAVGPREVDVLEHAEALLGAGGNGRNDAQPPSG